VLSGLIVFPFEEARSVLTEFARFTRSMPDELTVWMVTRQAPPLPFLPADVHGKEIVALAVFYAGAPADGEPLIEPLRGFGTPHGEHIGVQPYTAWQQAFDPLLTRARATTGSRTTSPSSATALSIPRSSTPADCRLPSARSSWRPSAVRRPARRRMRWRIRAGTPST
jgi:hypothetical protein